MVEVNEPNGDPANGQEGGGITLLTSIVLFFFFVGLATAGIRGWTADSRDVEYRLWPTTPVAAA
jgi:hypothetical protein